MTIIPFDPATAYLCVDGVATPVPAAQVSQTAQTLHATYYNGPANVTQQEMNHWCLIGHPTSGIVSDKGLLPAAGGSGLMLALILSILIFTGYGLLRRSQ